MTDQTASATPKAEKAAVPAATPVENADAQPDVVVVETKGGPGRDVWFWLFVTLGVFGLFYLLSDVLLPFVAAFAIAYLLDPTVERLAERKIPRWLAVTSVLGSFLIVLIAVILLAAPLIQRQLIQLIEILPEYTAQIREFLGPRIAAIISNLSTDEVSQLRDSAGQYAGRVFSWFGDVASGFAAGLGAIANTISLLVLTPIVAFYILKDWPQIVAQIHGLVPRNSVTPVDEILRDIDKAIAGFIRGQLSVCVILGAIYAVALSLVGLNFGFLIGLLSGLLSFIPYLGMAIGLLASVGVAFFQFDDPAMVALVAGIFFAGQVFEGNFLTPKLVGESVGLHAVWVIFALMVGGTLFGFTGILIAVPAAAVIGVLIRYGVKRYKRTSIYLGRGTDGAETSAETAA